MIAHLVLSLSLWSSTSNAETLDLEQYMEKFTAQSPALKAHEKSVESARMKKVVADLPLAPTLTLKGNQNDDRRPQNFGSAFSITRTVAKEYSASLGKLFSTGTQITLTGLAGETTSTAVVGGVPSDAAQGYSSLGVQLSQSLWRGGFGRSTSLRRERDEQVEKMELFNVMLKRSQTLIEAENLFWDWVFTSSQVQMAEQSFDRAQKLHAWFRNRVSNGIGDQADLLGAQVLMKTREVALNSAREDLETVRRKVVDALRVQENSVQPKVDLVFSRKLDQLVNGSGTGQPLRLDSAIQQAQSQMQKVVALEGAESVRPDLNLIAGYKTNPTDTSLNAASQSLGANVNPTTTVGVSLIWNLDAGVKNSVRSQSQADSLSAQFLAEKAKRDSDLAWGDLLRKHKDLSRRLEDLRLLAGWQSQKAKLEKTKLAQGRSITSTVIQAEQDAADGELNALKMAVETRKLESQARMYVRGEDFL